MKTDRELLELAAKAAGMELLSRPFVHSHGHGVMTKKGHWAPLTDDGDALRLAAVLRLHILHNDLGESVLWVSAVINKRGLHGVAEFQDESKRPEATRRAIVRAAAAIGEAME